MEGKKGNKLDVVKVGSNRSERCLHIAWQRIFVAVTRLHHLCRDYRRRQHVAHSNIRELPPVHIATAASATDINRLVFL